MIETDDLLREQAILVARGVRAMALVGQCEATPIEILRTYTLLEACACDGVLAFVVERGEGIADAGYAASPWVVDLYHWVTTDNAIPEIHQHRVIGLLLGYSPASIRDHEERLSYRPKRISYASAG